MKLQVNFYAIECSNCMILIRQNNTKFGNVTYLTKAVSWAYTILDETFKIKT